MGTTQLALEPPATRPHAVVIHVPGDAESTPSPEPPVIRSVTLPSSSRSPSLSAALPRLVTFWKKYRWYRSLGYPRTAARDKAWWHAREVPCPLSTAAH